LIGRRRGGFGWPGPSGYRFLEDGESCDEQYATSDRDHGHSADKTDTPLGLPRFKANAQTWRQRLRQELRLAPLTRHDRERLRRWLNNLRTREAWQAARLEHTIATKRLLLEALRDGGALRPTEASSAAEEISCAEDGEDT
jgi:hypothetical protein